MIMFQLLGDFISQTPYRGSATGPHWGTSVTRPPDNSLSTLPQPLWADNAIGPVNNPLLSDL